MNAFVVPLAKKTLHIPIISIGQVADALVLYLSTIANYIHETVAIHCDEEAKTTTIELCGQFEPALKRKVTGRITIEGRAVASLNSRIWADPFMVHVDSDDLGLFLDLNIEPNGNRTIAITKLRTRNSAETDLDEKAVAGEAAQARADDMPALPRDAPAVADREQPSSDAAADESGDAIAENGPAIAVAGAQARNIAFDNAPPVLSGIDEPVIEIEQQIPDTHSLGAGQIGDGLLGIVEEAAETRDIVFAEDDLGDWDEVTAVVEDGLHSDGRVNDTEKLADGTKPAEEIPQAQETVFSGNAPVQSETGQSLSEDEPQRSVAPEDAEPQAEDALPAVAEEQSANTETEAENPESADDAMLDEDSVIHLEDEQELIGKGRQERCGVVKGNGMFQFAIIGESQYQQELESIAGGRCRDGGRQLVAALLVPEPVNFFDQNAVAVQISKRTVGYLSFGASPAFLKALAEGEFDCAACGAAVVRESDSNEDNADCLRVKLDAVVPFVLVDRTQEVASAA